MFPCSYFHSPRSYFSGSAQNSLSVSIGKKTYCAELVLHNFLNLLMELCLLVTKTAKNHRQLTFGIKNETEAVIFFFITMEQRSLCFQNVPSFVYTADHPFNRRGELLQQTIWGFEQLEDEGLLITEIMGVGIAQVLCSRLPYSRFYWDARNREHPQRYLNLILKPLEVPSQCRNIWASQQVLSVPLSFEDLTLRVLGPDW